jgi:hypothetical protein
VDGRRPAPPPREYLDFVRAKRTQFAYLGATTFVANILLSVLFVYAVQAFQGKLEVTVSTGISSIVKYNIFGIAFGAVTSYLA